MTSAGTDTSVVVIGAGQAGLSVSYYLQRLGLDAGNDFVVLDRGPGTGGAWQFRWEALRIGSARCSCSMLFRMEPTLLDSIIWGTY